MADPYYPYVPHSLPLTDSVSGSIPRTSFAGYIPAEVPSLASPHVANSTGLLGVGSDYRHNDASLFQTGAYGVGDALVGSRVHSDASVLPTGSSIKGYSSLEDPDLGKKLDTPLATNPAVVRDISSERPGSKSDYDGLPKSALDSNVLFVGGLPNDCTRREVGHLFRPFIGYKDIRVVHKEPRRSGDKAMTLCFVEFVDAKCALTAMEALQDYKFDDKKPDSPILKIQFAHFPFHLPPDHGQKKAGY